MEQKRGSTKFTWNSAKTKIIAGMAATALVPTISIALISNYVTQNVISDQVSNSTLQMTKQASTSLDYKMEGVAHQVDLLAHNLNFTEFNQNKNRIFAKDLIHGTANTNPEYASVYFATTKKDMLDSTTDTIPKGYDPTTRDWFISAVNQNGKTVYSEPYIDAFTKKMVLTISQAVLNKKGEVVGVAAVDLYISNFSNTISQIKIGKRGNMTILGQDGKFISNPDKKKIGKKSPLWGKFDGKQQGTIDYTQNGVDKFSAYTTNQRTGWKFVSALDKSEIVEDATKIRTIGWYLTIIFGLLSAMCAYIIGRRIARNINSVKDALETASKGDFTSRVSVKTKDEFKDLELSFNNMMEQLSISLEKVGDTSKTTSETSAHLSMMTREANASLSEVALAIDEIAKGATLQAKNVHVSFEQMKELSKKLDGISSVTGGMESVSQRSMELSNKGLEQVVFLSDKSLETKSSTNEVTSIVKDVEIRMEEINTIIEAITRITDQTNLLSLNASIESARAGEHGKGFAVVANEVRKLADQSKASADEIKRIVDSIKTVVRNAVSAMEQTNQVVTEQDVAVKETQAIFNEILSAVHELAARVEEVQVSVKDSQQNKDLVNQEMDSITAVSEQTAAATEEVAASAEQISATMNTFTDHANELKELSEQLDNEIKKFKLD
ncbi:methyl-accepting chemotaxis protein [Neobacillus sp. M.A.Huq-85]